MSVPNYSRIIRQALLLLVAGLCLLPVGCRQQGEADGAIYDDLGREVALAVTPARVVSLAPSITEIIFAAGAGDKLVGVTTADDYPPAVAELPRFSALPVDYEAIVALEPDLVLASDQINSPQDAGTFAEIGIPVYFVAIRTLDDVLSSIRTVGGLLGTEVAAAQTADSLGASLAALEALTKGVEAQPSVLFLASDATLYAFGVGSYMHSLIALAGGTSVTKSTPTAAPILSSEFVLTRKPEVIVTSLGPGYDHHALLMKHPTWDVIPAVQNGRVYGVVGDAFVRPGPRLVEAAWQMASQLHPDLVTGAR